jgi:hypothetical protein
MMDGLLIPVISATRREIDKSVTKILRDADLTKPPIKIENLLHYLDVHRSFYDLEDPNLLQRFRHRVKVGGQKLINVVNKIKLEALWLPDQAQIWVDKSLPNPKQEWASFHDSTHKIFMGQR